MTSEMGFSDAGTIGPFIVAYFVKRSVTELCARSSTSLSAARRHNKVLAYQFDRIFYRVDLRFVYLAIEEKLGLT